MSMPLGFIKEWTSFHYFHKIKHKVQLFCPCFPILYISCEASGLVQYCSYLWRECFFFSIYFLLSGFTILTGFFLGILCFFLMFSLIFYFKHVPTFLNTHCAFFFFFRANQKALFRHKDSQDNQLGGWSLERWKFHQASFRCHSMCKHAQHKDESVGSLTCLHAEYQKNTELSSIF